MKRSDTVRHCSSIVTIPQKWSIIKNHCRHPSEQFLFRDMVTETVDFSEREAYSLLQNNRKSQFQSFMRSGGSDTIGTTTSQNLKRD